MASKNLNHAAIRPVKQRIEDELLARPGVTGVDINEKYTDGVATGQLSIVVYVESKTPAGDLADGEAIPATIEGIPTDVQEEKIVLHDSYTMVEAVAPQIDATQYGTLHGGISMGPCRTVFRTPPDVPTAGNYTFVGTLGAIVIDRVTKAEMALTNFHVACVDTGWAPGDTMAQPGRPDGGSCPADVFGSLTRAVLSEHVDGAVVSITAGKATECTIEGIGDVKGHAAAVLNSDVRKRGRTTELTFGRVTSVDASVSINYGDGLGNRTLKNQVRIVADTAQSAVFSAGGDSGSVVVDGNNMVIGLLFGGSTQATYANPIGFVMDELGVDLCVKSDFVPIKTKLSGWCHEIPKTLIAATCQPVKTNSWTLCSSIPRTVIRVTCEPVLVKTRIRILCEPVQSLPTCKFPFDPGEFRPPRFRNPGVLGPRDLEALYGAPDDGEAVNDAFWIGYYTALQAVVNDDETDAEG